MIAAMALVGIGCGAGSSTADGGTTDPGATASASPSSPEAGVVSADGAADALSSGATFTDLYTTVFAATCAGASCHNPGTHGGISFLTRQSGYASVHVMVRPGDASAVLTD